MGRRAPRCDQRGANRAVGTVELLLQSVQALEEGLERTAVQGLVGRRRLRGREGLEALVAEDAIRRVREQHGVAIERDLEGAASRITAHRVGRTARKQRRRGHATVQGLLHVARFRGEEQVAAECPRVAIGACPGRKGRPDDVQSVGMDGVEHTQARVGELRDNRITSTRSPTQLLVDRQELGHESEPLAGVSGSSS